MFQGVIYSNMFVCILLFSMVKKVEKEMKDEMRERKRKMDMKK